MLTMLLMFAGAVAAAEPPLHATTLPPFDPDHEPKPAPNAFSPYSATSFSTLRQRWNLNAIRIPLIEPPPERAADYRKKLATVIRTAQKLQLKVILAGSPEDRFAVIDDTLPCRPQPDPAVLTASLQARFMDYERRAISWTASSFVPGKLITDYASQDATSLENGWPCAPGEQGPASPPGIGLMIQAHLWGGSVRGLFAVSAAGGSRLPRGGVAILYGPIFASRDTSSPFAPSRLAGTSIEITDHNHRTYRARLLHVSAGWGQANFVVPDDAAPGPARLTVHHSDGTSTTAETTIVDAAPGLWSALGNGRGPAIAWLGSRPLWSCTKGVCRTVPVPVASATRVRLSASGLRHGSKVRVTFGDRELPVVSVRPSIAPGVEDVIVELAPDLKDSGEADLICFADDQPSNVVRLRVIPADKARVELGRYLFYDQRLSVSGTYSCASCHRQDLAFTDGRATARGATGQAHTRSAMTLVNVAHRKTLTWANPSLRSLEAQVLTPLTGTAPVEMGAAPARILNLLRNDPIYRVLVPASFPNETSPISIANLARAIAAFERTILSTNSPYDRFHFQRDLAAISESAKRGEVLFYSDPIAKCFRCHSGPDFTDSRHHNTGVSNSNRRFLTPTLRNIALTAPYMHDGSIATLEEAVDQYASGGRNHPAGLDPLLRAIPLSAQNRRDVVEFLRTLTDTDLLTNPAFADPW